MKKVTVNSNCHPTSATFLVPEIIEDTHEAIEYITEESEREYLRLGRYGPKRKRQNEIWRKLCGVNGCRCFVEKERC